MAKKDNEEIIENEIRDTSEEIKNTEVIEKEGSIEEPSDVDAEVERIFDSKDNEKSPRRHKVGKIDTKEESKIDEHDDLDEGNTEPDADFYPEDSEEIYEGEILEDEEVEPLKKKKTDSGEEIRDIKEREREEKEARRKLEAKRRKQEKEEKKKEKKEQKKALKEEREKDPVYRRKRRIIRIISGAIVLVILIALAVFLINRYAKFSGYNVTANVDMTNVDEHTQVFKFNGGFIKCAGDGVTFFDKKGIRWSESFAMADPQCDVCEDYIAVTDMKSTEVYLYGTSGFLKKINLTRVATDVEVSKYGSIAVVTNDGDANFIEIKDKDGNEIINIKTVFSSTGYLSDISLSEDGSRLAGTFISVADSSIKSKVVFYDFTKDEQESPVIGEFDQYDGTLLTTVEYINNKVVAVGDNAFTIYSVSGNPDIIYEEKDLPWQAQSLFMSDRYIGFIVENTESDNAYAIKAYNLRGKQVCDESFNFAYNHVAFAGSNVVLNTEYDCDVINFAGTHKFSGTFDNRIYYLIPYDDGVNFILLSSGHTQFIKLR